MVLRSKYIFLKTLQLGSFLSLFQHVSLGFRIVQVGGADLLQTGHGEIRPATTRAAHRHPVGQCSARGGTLLFLSNHLTNHRVTAVLLWLSRLPRLGRLQAEDCRRRAGDRSASESRENLSECQQSAALLLSVVLCTLLTPDTHNSFPS